MTSRLETVIETPRLITKSAEPEGVRAMVRVHGG
jgi:hypothetical protein